MSILHETCLEYFRRRLSEGWKCISLKGHNAVLLSPDGNVRRELDLRHDIETLRPTAAGDEENIANATSGAGQHWNDVKEAVPDGDATVVYTGSPTYQRDLYNIADHVVGTGIINHIIAYAVWRCTHTGLPHCKIAIKSGTGAGAPDTVSESGGITNTATDYRTDSHQWDINPATGLPFIWDEIDKLQIGVSLNDVTEAPCFTGDTRISLSDGSYKEVKDIRPGDRVAYYDFAEGKVKFTTVTKVNEHSADEMGPYYLVLNKKLKVTPEHPLDKPDGAVITAGKVKVGDSLQGETGSIEIFSVEKVGERVKTYSLETESKHYFIDGFSDMAKPLTTYCTQEYVEVDYTTPVVATNAATGMNPVSGILNATLTDDLGDTYDGRFQWGRTEDYGNDTPWQAGAFTTGDTFTQLIEGLEPGTLYHFRAQAKDGIGTVSGADVAFRTLKPSIGKGYAFSRELHIKRATDVVDKASIAASAITTLADCKGINLVEVPSSLTLTVEATYDAAATQGIKVHVKTSLTDRAIGTHSGADGAAALTDAEAHFVVNELIGLTIKNLTDGSSGAITANTGTGVTATLVGGTDNDWDSGDAYIIEGAGYDTEDWDSFAPAFGAGSSIRQTEHYDVDPVYLKAFVENLDGVKAVTDVKIIMAVGA